MEVRIRKIWVNEKSTKDQVTVQFAQELEARPGNNPLVAVAQGINFGPSLVTALMSFSKDVAMKFFGTVEVDYSKTEFEAWPTPDNFVAALREQTGDPNFEIAISVVENVTQNPATPNQQPKINPQTGAVLTVNGQPIYRHTELTSATQVRRVFVQHDGAAGAANQQLLQATPAHAELTV